MEIKPFFDPRTFTLTYVVWDPETSDAVVIDPVLDYEAASSKTWTESAEDVVRFVRKNSLKVHFILETHAHADHLSGSKVLKGAFPEAKVAIGSRITEVQALFKGIFDLPDDFPTDGSQFDQLLEDGETVSAGSLEFKTVSTPGHTPACSSFVFGDSVFVGDALMMPDMGTGRCDFPGGSATDMYHSVHNVLYSMPDDTQVYVGHDYQPGGRELEWVAPMGRHKESNVALTMARTEKDFVAWREARDATLSAPKLLFQSVQVNVDAGRLPQPHDNEIRYLKIPINVFKPPTGGELALDPV